MKSIAKYFSILAILTLSQIGAADRGSTEKLIEKGETIGTFQNYEWGDYPHLEIMADKKLVSFFAFGGPHSVFEEHAAKLKGEKIKVSWEKVKRYIPEAGEEIELTKTTAICSFRPIKLESPFKEKVSVCKK